MKAIFLDEYGEAGNIRVGEAAKPTPKPGEVLIKVAYAGLRWGDIMQRNGFPRRAVPTPYILGQEASGIVESVGEGVTAIKPGQRVVAFPLNGAYAEYLSAAQDRVTVVADRVPLDQVLAYPVNMRTAHLMIYAWAKVQEGETVLLHAAGGGVGLLALQILKRRFKNVKVIAIASTSEKLALCRTNGADYCIDRTKEDYVEAVKAIVGAKPVGMDAGPPRGGVHVSFNGVSGATLATDPLVIRKRGRWVIYGYSGGRAIIDTSGYGYDAITIMPFSSIAFIGSPEYAAAGAFVQEWLVKEELIQPTVRSLEEVRAAQLDMEQGRTTGKVVFKVGE